MKKYPWTSTFVFCLLVFAALAAFKVTEIRGAMAFAASFPEPSASVKAYAVTQRSHQPSIDVIGTVRHPKQLTLHNELAGKISKLNMPAGSRIKQGQLLMQLDISTEQANIKSLQAQRRLAHSELQRMQSLRKRDAVSQQQLDKAQTDIQVLSANITALESSIAKKTLLAPFDGQVGIHEWQRGEFVASNSLIANLQGDATTLWLDFQVPQFYPLLTPGQKLAVKDSSGNTLAQAVVTIQDTQINANTRGRRYRAEIQPKQQLQSNSTVQISVPSGNAQTLSVIPNSSLQHAPSGDYVFVLQEDAENKGFRAQQRKVQILQRQGEQVVLKEGLQGGETIAADGAFKLRDGLLVFTAR